MITPPGEKCGLAAGAAGGTAVILEQGQFPTLPQNEERSPVGGAAELGSRIGGNLNRFVAREEVAFFVHDRLLRSEIDGPLPREVTLGGPFELETSQCHGVEGAPLDLSLIHI